jgi:hypothetical protein
LLPREGGNSRDRDLGGSRGGSIPGVSKDARVRTTRARTARKRARPGLWRRRRVSRLGEWRSPDHFVSNALNPLVIYLSPSPRCVSWTCVSVMSIIAKYMLSTSRKSSPNPERDGSQLDAPGRRTRASEPDPRGSLRTRGAPRWAPAAAAGATVGAAARAPPPRLVCPPSSGRSAPPRRERRGRAWTWTTRRTRGSRSCAWAARAGPRVVTRKRAGLFRGRDPRERAAEAYPRVLGRRFLKPM